MELQHQRSSPRETSSNFRWEQGWGMESSSFFAFSSNTVLVGGPVSPREGEIWGSETPVRMQRCRLSPNYFGWLALFLVSFNISWSGKINHPTLYRHSWLYPYGTNCHPTPPQHRQSGFLYCVFVHRLCSCEKNLCSCKQKFVQL